MLQVTPRKRLQRGSIVTRRRFQFVVALLLGAAVPLAARFLFSPSQIDKATFNAFFANIAAVAVAFWARLSIEPYPGIRSSYVILPTAAAAHGLILAFFLFTRLPYDRVGFLLGFVLHVLWLYAVYFIVQRRTQLRIGVVPYGAIARLQQIEQVEWVPLAHPRLDAMAGCDALVADFSSDLPDEWESFLADAALAGTIVYQVKHLHESLTGLVELEHLSENSFGSLLPARGFFHLKTVIDWLVAAALLPPSLLVMGLAAAAIRMDGGGPILFRQTRIGHAGRAFTVYKFRTMRIGHEHDDPRLAAMTETADPRITRVGAFLRRTRIDELPQIINILKGEMSWIGPRPEAEVLSLWYVSELPFYRYRHVVKPGISGWAQTNQGHVADVGDVHTKLQYDFYYIKYFSPWLDLLILFKTVKTMLTGFGSR